MQRTDFTYELPPEEAVAEEPAAEEFFSWWVKAKYIQLPFIRDLLVPEVLAPRARGNTGKRNKPNNQGKKSNNQPKPNKRANTRNALREKIATLSQL